MAQVLEKVTAFVTRRTTDGEHLLLFHHPFAGVQIPAGTVEYGETPESAALREAREETGLDGLVVSRYLGTRNDPLPPDHGVICQQTTVYARPDTTSFDFARLPRGLTVKVERTVEGFVHVTYQELDQLASPNYVTYQITGWIPSPTLARTKRRHFYQLDCTLSTPEAWAVDVDHHRFELFWASLADLPAIVSPQDRWIAMLKGNEESNRE